MPTTAPKPAIPASTVLVATKLRKKTGPKKFKVQPNQALAAGALLSVGDMAKIEADGRGVPFVQVLKTLKPDGTQKDDVSTQDLWVKANNMSGASSLDRVKDFQTTSTVPPTTGGTAPKLSDQIEDDGGDGGLSDFTDTGSAITTAVNFPYSQAANVDTGKQLTQDNVEGAPSAMGGDVLGEVGSISTIFQVGLKLREWNKMDGWTRADNIVALIGGVGGLGATATDLAQQGEYLASGNATQQAQEAGTFGSSVAGDFITAAVSLWTAFRSWWDVIATAGRKGAESIAKGIGGALQQTLTVGKELMDAAKQLLEAINQGIGHLAQAIPGVGIAISGLKVIMRAWDLTRASISQGGLRSDKQVAKLLLGGKVGETLKGKKPDPATIGPSFDTTKVKDRLVDVKGKGKVDWLTGYEDHTIRELAQELGGFDHAPTDAEVVDTLWGRYDDQKFHQRNSAKEITRATIEIAQEITTIGGEIATLTGVGAVAGAAIKGGASGWKSLTSGFRWLKQLIRDKVDEAQREKVKSGALQEKDVKHFSVKHFFREGAKGAMRPGYDPKSSVEKGKRYAEKAVALLKEIAGVKTKVQAKAVAKTLENLRVDIRELDHSEDIKTAFNVVVKVFKRR